jgi:hypothetical protein
MTDKPLRKKLTQRGEKVVEKPVEEKEKKPKSTEVDNNADK